MTKSTTFRSWALAVLAVLALGACNRDWDTGRAASVGAGSMAITTATAQDAMGMASAAGGQGLQAGAASPRAAFAALPDRGDLVGYPQDRVLRREGAYTWHRADVSEEHALRAIFDGELRITAPDGQLLAFEYERHVEHPTGDWTWVGRLRDASPGRQAILTFGAKAVFGNIAQSAAAPLRLAMRDGVSWLVETDPALLAGVESRVLRPESPDFLLPPMYMGSLSGPKASGDTVSSSGESGGSSSSTSSSSTTVVDVLVGYTPGFATAQGGDSQARTRINFLVDVANQGYVNSQIDARVRLVHAMQVNYPDATDNGDTLEKLTGYKSGTGKTTPDPAFSALRNARETFGADLVTLVRKFNTPENDGCGIAWLIGGGLTTITQGYEYFGYSVVSDGIDQGDDGKNYFCRDETMVHEFAHNMGSAHDIETAKGDDGVLQTKEYGRYTYSFGYKTGPGAGDFYTIMAYRDKRDSQPQQAAYRVFSNPKITYCGGFACGIDNQADNALSLSQTMPVISNFRAAVVGTIPMQRRMANDVNGDGKSDLLWHNDQLARFSYWTMDGPTVLSQVGVASPIGYRIAAVGDFNGDHYLDILWTSNAKDLHLWLGNGASFVSSRLYDYCCGWEIVGSGDVNADGKDDLLWHNAKTGYFSYWIMDGSRVVAQVGYAITPGYRMVAASDFNGDGFVDLLWTSNAGDLWMWIGNGTSFSSTRLLDYCCDWQIVGAKDVNGDGKGDVLWHNAQQGRFSYWIMNGVTVVSQISMPIAVGYRIASAGDYNGDGYADLVWTSNAGDLWMWVGNGSSFATSRLYDYCCGWQLMKPSFY